MSQERRRGVRCGTERIYRHRRGVVLKAATRASRRRFDCPRTGGTFRSGEGRPTCIHSAKSMYRQSIWLVLLLLAAIAPCAGAALVVPAYNSSNYDATIYLDFVGDTTPNYGTYHPNTTPAY